MEQCWLMKYIPLLDCDIINHIRDDYLLLLMNEPVKRHHRHRTRCESCSRENSWSCDDSCDSNTQGFVDLDY